MIIGIDASSIAYGTGVSNYTQNLIDNLLQSDQKNTYKIFFSSLRLPLPNFIKNLKKHKNVKIYHYRLPPMFFEFFWNKLHVIPIEFFIGACHIFHTSDWTQPPTYQSQTITTVHDLTPLMFPKWHHPKVIKNHTLKLNLAIKECDHFICVSQNTQNDLLKLFPTLNKDKTTVIYEAAENKYSEFKKLTKEKQDKEINQIKNKYNLHQYFLSQGTREPRKNLKRLIKAFIKFSNQNPDSKFELAITGKYGWGQDIDTQNAHIKILGYIPEEDMVALHAGSYCLVYPSLYEGFGLPLVKAMAVGIPIITSNNSSLKEIASQGAILVNPKLTNSINNAIKKITNNPKRYKELSQESFKKGQRFSWQKTAKDTLDIYKQICPC